MTDYSTSPSSDEEEPGRRPSAPQHGFLSHLHTQTRRASTLRRSIGTSSDHPLSEDQAHVEPRGQAVSPPKRRSLAVSFAMIDRDDANMGTRTDGQGAAHQQHEEAGGVRSTSSCASSNIAEQPTPVPGESSRFRGSTIRDTWSEHADNPDNCDGDFTFRCSSTIQKARVSNETSGFDLLGSVICGPCESPISSISSHRYSGKRCVCSWATNQVCCSFVRT